MKKICLSMLLFTLPLLASAQEIWSAASVIDRSSSTPIVVGAIRSALTEGIYAAGNADGPDTNIQGSLATETITGETESIKLSIVSTPDNNGDGTEKVFWSIKGGEGSNEALTTDECNPKFESCLMPKGNPTIVYWDYYEYNSSGNKVFRVGNTDFTYWTNGKPLPVKGSYLKIEANTSGNLTLGVYVNKGNHPLYIVDGDTYSLFPTSSIKVKFYYQNTGFAFYRETTTNEYGEEFVISQSFINEGTMPDDYIIQHTNGVTQNRPALGYITFPVEAGKTYYAFNPKSQLGCYGFQFLSDGSGSITSKTEVDDICYIINLSSKQAEVIRGKNKYSGAVVIPNKITSDGVDYSVTSIGNSAFAYCNSLISVSIPNSISSIGSSAFAYCNSLTSVTIPNSVGDIGGYAFFNCNELTSVSIPNSVTTIGDCAFYGCTGLTSVSIPNSVTSIGGGAFYGCTGLTSLTIPNSVITLGDDAFSGCNSLNSMSINVKSIGERSFSGCTGLTSITIGSEVKSISGIAFEECINLSSIISKMEYPCTISNYCFPDNVFKNSTLYIPKGTMERYKMKDYWNKFENIVEGEPGSSVGPGTTKCATPTISYNNKELTFSCATEGVDFKYTITDSDIKTDYANKVSLSATYEISVYAMKEGLGNSDVATATLVWTDAIFTETTEPSTSAKAVTESIPVLISANGGVITVKSEQEGQAVAVYTADGKALGSANVKDGQATVATNMQRGEIVIVKVGGRSVKVKMSDF